MNLEEGKKIPAFNLDGSNGKKIKLSDIGTENIVIYFYPKDDTPGCTNQAKDFSKLKSKFSKLNSEIFGISPDSIEKHKKFITKHNLKIILLADEENKTSIKYGVWKEKNLYGKKYMGIERTTFLVNKDKRIIKIWKKVRVNGHAEEVLEVLKEIQNS
ncbi:MAG: thioredoxin-dependent thiol peroxidase [Rhodospirillaceae bacterium]|nr:thioredoxin-dependent thiol peroxidase [Rhodospirillaceae bacterium]|tara:strand:+ start:415 stop:888 length:474 start_codon:yes stop_codon:yes gene_type:complete